MVLQEGLDGMIVFFLSLPLALPLGYDVVAGFLEQPMFFFSFGEDVRHGLAQMARVRLVAVLETGGTPVPKTSVVFEDGPALLVVPIDRIETTGEWSELTNLRKNRAIAR